MKASAAGTVTLDCHEHFMKQTLRSRCMIVGANGTQQLNIPVIGRGKKIIMRDVRISYAENWQRYHRQAIISAYGSSAFFEHYFPELESHLMRRESYLIDFLFPLLQWQEKSLRLKINWACTVGFRPYSQTRDLRLSEFESEESVKPYHQVFMARHGFIKHLSTLDIVMNEGPYWRDYLITPPLHKRP